MSEWISVKDRYPDDYTVVFATDDYTSFIGYFETYTDGSKSFLGADIEDLTLFGAYSGSTMSKWCNVPKLPPKED